MTEKLFTGTLSKNETKRKIFARRKGGHLVYVSYSNIIVNKFYLKRKQGSE